MMVLPRWQLAIGAGFFLIAASSQGFPQRDDASASSRVETDQVGRTEPDTTLDRSTPETKLSDSGLSSTRLGWNSDYVIGPEDVLMVDVFNVPELSKEVRVANDGMIALPLIGQVQAAGLNSQQLRRELESKYGETYLEQPQISVFIKEFRAQPVSVIGAVEKPGLYQVTAPRTLIEMLSMAGGLGTRMNTPAGRTVYVTRKGGFGDLELPEGMRVVGADKIEIDLHALLYSHDDALNIEIRPNDVISVSRSDIVYVTGGGVKHAGGFVLEDRDKVTVLQAVAMAEGFDPSAAKSQARIIRRHEDGSRSEIPVDLNKVLKGRAPDVELAPNDILFVPDSAQKLAIKRGAEAAISTVSGLLIFHR